MRWGRKEGCCIREWASKWASVKGRGGCPLTRHSLPGGLLVYGASRVCGAQDKVSLFQVLCLGCINSFQMAVLGVKPSFSPLRGP